MRRNPTKFLPRLALICLILMMSSLACSDVSRSERAPDSSEFKVGYLRCEIAGAWSYLVGSSRYVDCEFTPSQGEPENYRGELSKLGVDIGYLHSGVIVWQVLAPASTLREGALSGHYAGASAGAALGVGGGMNVLVGGLGESISLQPVSVEGNVGAEIAVGAAYLNLEPGWP